jgi:acyl-CoA thioesterase-1
MHAIWSAVLVSLLVAVTGGCGGTGPTRPDNPTEVQVIAVLGDSLAVSPSREQSFPAVLQSYLIEAHPNWTITNAGVAGDTTAGGLRRLDGVLAGGVDVLIVALGANDGLRGVDVGQVERNLSEILRTAQARGVEVLLCGMETPPFHGLEYTVAFHRLFPRLASAFDIPLVPFLLSGVALNPELNGGDGVHPNAAGARRIAETIWPHLEPLLMD